MTTTRILAASAALLLAALPAAAQQPNASTAAFGMAGNYTAAATGYDAVAWNPANLGLADNSRFSFSLATLGGTTGMDPVDFNAIARFSGKTITAQTREDWLQRIGTGTERGRADGGVSLLALSIGRLGFQVGTTAYGFANLNQDAVEALLFGNAGRTGTPRNLRFNGSNARGSAFTTGAASFALPLYSDTEAEASIGITGKYVVGNAYASARDGGSLVTTNNVAIAFPMVYGGGSDLGSGKGLDVGLAWRSGATRAGLTVQNVFNSFRWDTTKLKAKAGTASFDGATSSTDFDDIAYAAAPLDLREAVAAERFKPAIALGASHRVGSSLLVSADLRSRAGEGIAADPKSHAGVGAEFTPLGFLPLRAGVAKISDGWETAGGIGLRLWHYELGVAGSLRNRDRGKETGVMVSLLSFK